MDLKNTEHVKVGNRNIVKIISGGGIDMVS